MRAVDDEVLAYFKVLLQNLSGGTGETNEKLQPRAGNSTEIRTRYLQNTSLGC
jgi:hypothetical protein